MYKILNFVEKFIIFFSLTEYFVYLQCDFNFIIMTFEEFNKQREHVFNIGCVSFHYYKLSYNLWSLCVSIPTERKEWYFEEVRPSSTMSCFDAFTSYNNLYNSLNKFHE